MYICPPVTPINRLECQSVPIRAIPCPLETMTMPRSAADRFSNPAHPDREQLRASRRDPDLIDAKTAAAIVGVSRRTWFRYVDNGDVPRPVRFGGSVKWRRDEIHAWIQDGCPRVSEEGDR